MPRHDHDPMAELELLRIWTMTPALQKIYPAPGTGQQTQRRQQGRRHAPSYRHPRTGGRCRRAWSIVALPFRSAS
jgi:hypothetical protein